jgi:small-conductance mechanosensitive channel
MLPFTRFLTLILTLGCLLARADESREDEELHAGPLQTTTRFLDAAHEGDFATAAKQLSLDYLPAEDRESEGLRVARRLMFLLDQYVTLSGAEVAKPVVGNRFELGELPLGRLKVPVELVKRGENWVFSARTVRAVDPAFEEHGALFFDDLPSWMLVRSVWVLNRFHWAGLAALVALGVLLTWLLGRLGTPLARRLTKLTRTTIDDELVSGFDRPTRSLVFLGVVALGTRPLGLPLEAHAVLGDLFRSAAIAAGIWLCWAAGDVLAAELTRRAQQRGDLSSRAVRTQVTVLHRVAKTMVATLGGALVLVQFPAVRSLGVSLLASAGVAGVVLGLAAQRSIGNLLGGIQLSFTQPVRIGDTVIVESEWGTVEEITLTYVVVKLWDLRRLVVPITYFLEKPFQNWTRSSTEIVGTVMLWADFGVDVEALREELMRVLEPQRGKLWNGNTAGLQVTEMTDRAVQVRVLVSAADASQTWDLRCLVREKLLGFLKRQSPEALPRVRTQARTEQDEPLRGEQAC